MKYLCALVGKFWGGAKLLVTCSLLMTVGIMIVTCLLQETGVTVGPLSLSC